MNPDVRATWVAALRSGRFEQGRGKLTRLAPGLHGTRRVTNCCLGVLCELAVEARVELRTEDLDDRRVYGVEGNDNWPPSEVQRWAGLPSRSPHVAYGNVTAALGDLNDDFHLSFDVIADLIERDENL